MTEQQPTTQQIRRLVEGVLKRQGAAYLHIAPQRNTFECKIPFHLSMKQHVCLVVGHALERPTHDLVLDDVGVSATLEFGSQKVWCVIPWDCLVAVIGPDKSGFVWDRDAMPADEQPVPQPLAEVVSLQEYKARRANKARL